MEAHRITPIVFQERADKYRHDYNEYEMPRAFCEPFSLEPGINFDTYVDAMNLWASSLFHERTVILPII